MSSKLHRFSKIKSFLRIQSEPVTVTQIHEALSKRMGLDISRKTIERDMIEMEELEIVNSLNGIPLKFSLSRPTEIEVILKVEEIQTILENLPADSDLGFKLRKLLL